MLNDAQYKELLSYAEFQTGTRLRNSHHAEDILHDSIVIVLKSDKLRQHSNIMALIKRIINCQTINAYWTQSKHVQFFDWVENKEVIRLVCTDRMNEEPSYEVPDDLIEELIECLSDQNKEVIRLVCTGRTNEEIAAILGKSTAAVQRQRHRAVAQIKESVHT